MDFTNTYRLITETPKPGAMACLGISTQYAKEVSDALAVGTVGGAGQPDANWVYTAGTIRPGQGVQMTSAAVWELGTSPDVSAALPKALFFVHEGDKDFTGRYVGRLTALRGLARFKTSAISGSSFSPGDALYMSSGNFVLKVNGDHRQIVGWVGPDGLRNGLLDVMFEAASWG